MFSWDAHPTQMEAREAEHALLTSFSNLVALLDRLIDAADSGKQVARARMLHGVISQRFPNTTLEQVQRMGVEWLSGMLDVTFPVESSLVDAGFSVEAEAQVPRGQDGTTAMAPVNGDADGCSVPLRLSNRLLQVMDDGHAWAVELVRVVVGARPPPSSQRVSECGPDGERRSSSGSAHGEGTVAHEEAKAALQAALSSGKAKVVEVDDEDGLSPEARVIGADLWEALCWRRGSMRYYIVSTAVRAALGPSATSSSAAAKVQTDTALNAQASRAVAPYGTLIEEAVEALDLLLRARSGGEAGNQLLSWGILSTTHLLALVYAAELCYWRWASLACLLGPEAPPAAANDAQGSDSEHRAAPACGAATKGDVAEEASGTTLVIPSSGGEDLSARVNACALGEGDLGVDRAPGPAPVGGASDGVVVDRERGQPCGDSIRAVGAQGGAAELGVSPTAADGVAGAEAPAESEAAQGEERWRCRALKLLHRYLYVVEVRFECSNPVDPFRGSLSRIPFPDPFRGSLSRIPFPDPFRGYLLRIPVAWSLSAVAS